MRKRRDPAGKVVLVTGGAGGLGRAFAAAFARAGARPVLLDLAQGPLQEAEEELRRAGLPCLALACDVTDEQACRRAVQSAADQLGGVDWLVNNAGLTHRSPFAQTSLAVYRKVMEVNYLGSVAMTRAALPWLMRRQGLVAVISSVAGFAPLLGRTGYAASKHALHGFFNSLRPELAEVGVGVSIVCPSFTSTGIAKAALDGDGQPTSHPQSTVGRVWSAAEVAEAVLAACCQSRPLTVLSPVGKLSWWVNRLAPGLYARLMARSLKSELQR